ncbi:uncharacterized protein LOC143032783 [Oratosquilla oratoria]|uniref:uncharacterized protein LOC143032783 n=1 Tax=Oratosquilla oratoria TaxID=337810 RepID=UPI003F75EAC9
MDWFRKLLGWETGPNNRPQDFGGSDDSRRHHDRWSDSSPFHRPGGGRDERDIFNDFWGERGGFKSPFGSMIQQMDEMMFEMMRDIHQSPEIHVYTYDEDDDGDETPGYTNPRDSMLKVPDSENTQPPGRPRIPPGGPRGPDLPFGPRGDYHDSQDIDGDNGDFEEFQGFGGSTFHGHPGNPFSMMDSILRSFGGGGFFGTFGHDSDGFPSGQNWSSRIDESPRESMLKSDTDLDSSISEELLKEGPKYEHPGSPAQIQPQPQPQLVPSTPGQPSVNFSYSSSTYSYVRKPDGSVEETRKYRDSSGREEVTVTTREPDSKRALPPAPSPNPTPPSPPGGIVPDPGHPGDPEYSAIFSRLFGK